MYKLDLDDGKYTIIEDLNKGKFEALRYGKEWRNLVGDNLILGLVYKIQELETVENAMKILKDNGYIVKKITKKMEQDMKKCEEMNETGEYMECCDCSCNVCIVD